MDSAHAGIHMAEQAFFLRQGGDFGDRIDHALRISRGRADQQDGIGRDSRPHGAHIHPEGERIERRQHHFQVEILGGFMKSMVRRLADDDFRLC